MAGGFLHVLVQYYADQDPARQAELDFCVRRNLDNPQIAAVHAFLEAGTPVPADMAAHPAFRPVAFQGWLTFAAALDYANRTLAGQPTCLSNLDIFLDAVGDWSRATEHLHNRIVLALARHEFDGKDGAAPDPLLGSRAYANAQDAWLFLPPLAVPDCDFEIGFLGCDNAFAHRLKQAGYLPVNVPQVFRVFHYDLARGKTGSSMLKDHARRRDRPPNRHPERSGYYLLPDIDAIDSVDGLIAHLRLGRLQRYEIICDILSRHLQVQNPE